MTYLIRELTAADGRVFTHHAIEETKIDLKNLKITFIFKSWMSLESAEKSSEEFVRTFTDCVVPSYDENTIESLKSSLPSFSWGFYKIEDELAPKTFEDFRLDRQSEISDRCRAEISGNYRSDALGEVHTYPSKQTDQLNMIASVTDSYNPSNPADWVTPFWCANQAGVWEYKLHTASQIQKAGSDGKAHITSCISKNAMLQEQIKNATTKEELGAIIWTND